MPQESKPPTIMELVRERVFHHLGIPGLVVLALLGVAIYMYANWDKVKMWPGVASIVDYIDRWPIPQADTDRFSILVARLESDTNHNHQRLIVEELKEFDGVQVLVLDRTIPLEGPVPEEMEKQGHESARRYLKESGGSVLIWGSVLNRGGSTVLKLYWTPSRGNNRKPRRYDAPRVETQFRLPELFWSELASIIRVLVASRHAELLAGKGKYMADWLRPFIVRVRTLLDAGVNRVRWDGDARSTIRIILANALMVLGEQSGKKAPLEEAVATYREALKERTRDRMPQNWAATQNNLGIALRMLGERENSTSHLKGAVTAFREALKEYTRDGEPLYWAKTQNNLGNALLTLGERESGTSHLVEAVAAYREALKEQTRDSVPLEWAMTQTNLGSALLRLGERESSTIRFEEAVTIFREALKEYTRDRVPLYWARIQNNLGTALLRLGERESGITRLEEAVAAYREALKEQSRDREPLNWARTQNNLGSALLRLGERESGTSHLVEAVAAYREALKEQTRDSVPLDWAMTQYNLGWALKTLGERESGTSHLEEAVTAYREALKEYTRDRQPLNWARTQKNLGNTLLRLGERESGTGSLEEAVTTFREALKVLEIVKAHDYTNSARSSLRQAEELLHQRRR